jgi:hypothetical protein
VKMEPMGLSKADSPRPVAYMTTVPVDPVVSAGDPGSRFAVLPPDRDVVNASDLAAIVAEVLTVGALVLLFGKQTFEARPA